MAVLKIIGVVGIGILIIIGSQIVVKWMEWNNKNDMIRNNRENGKDALMGVLERRST